MKDISLVKTFFSNFVILKIDLEKLKYKTNSNQYKAYNSETLRKNDVQFYNIDYFLSCLKESVRVLMLSYNQKYEYNIEIRQIWEHEYEKGDFQEDHVHFDMHFSYIIYYKGESKTVFKNPIGYTLQAMYSDFHDYLGQYEYTPNLKEGTLIVFPSFVPHYVKKQSKAKTIVGDVRIKRL
tara:strand:+ start:77 stop:616 length:540 start_codon:yes stop_codon:yes gene_type:complete